VALKRFGRRPPEVAVGQVWSPKDQRIYDRVRVVCPYPFAGRADGPTWVIEHLDRVCALDRMPESTLRNVFRLERDVAD
jgi:hypothetical protein